MMGEAKREDEAAEPLVIGRKRDGRAVYDPERKRALVAYCQRPGVSVARTALENGINANVLRSWIARSRQARTGRVVPADAGAFVPVVSEPVAVETSRARLAAKLPNGVRLELSELDGAALERLLAALSELPCSGSTRG